MPQHRQNPSQDNGLEGKLEDTLEVTSGNTQNSFKCKSCGSMFSANEGEVPSSTICPECGSHDVSGNKLIQSSDEGY